MQGYDPAAFTTLRRTCDILAARALCADVCGGCSSVLPQQLLACCTGLLHGRGYVVCRRPGTGGRWQVSCRERIIFGFSSSQHFLHCGGYLCMLADLTLASTYCSCC